MQSFIHVCYLILWWGLIGLPAVGTLLWILFNVLFAAVCLGGWILSLCKRVVT